MHKKIIMACMAIVAFAAFAASSASAAQLKEGTTGATLGVGASVLGTNVGTTTFTAGELTVTCTTATMGGTITADANGTIAAEITTPPSSKAPHFTGTGTNSDCTSPLGSVKPTVTSDLCLHLPANTDIGSVTGCGLPVKFSLNVTGVITCNYSTNSVAGEIDTHTAATPVDARITISEAPATEEGGKFLCPDTGKLDMKFELTTTGGTTLVFLP